MMQSDPAQRDHPVAFNADIFCAGCGYELAGLPLTGLCPECAKPIAESIERRRLGLASASYLSCLEKGSLLVIAGLLLEIAAGFVPILTPHGSLSSSGALLFAGTEPVLMLLVALGVRMLTIDDPGLPPRDQARPNKLAMRVAAIGLILIKCVAIYAASQPITSRSAISVPGLGTLLPIPLAFVSALLEFGLWLTLATGLSNYTRWLAVRVPDQRLFKQAKTLGWMFPIALVAALVLGLPCGMVPRLIPFALMVFLLGAVRDRIRRVRTG